MDTFKELKKLLELSPEASSEDVSKTFAAIAKILMSDVAIKRGKELYRFKEIEFYFFNKNHKDIITHPRICDAMKWYVNDFGGIDLTFKSYVKTGTFKNSQKKDVVKPYLDDAACFGGILIRKIVNIKTNEELKSPWACSELFRLHDTLGSLDDFPMLIEYNTGYTAEKVEQRLNLKSKSQSVENKVKYILSVYGNAQTDDIIKEMSDNFERFEECLYRYY